MLNAWRASSELRTAGLCCGLLAGGLGELAYPLVSDLKREISEAYGVLSGTDNALRAAVPWRVRAAAAWTVRN